MKHWVALGIFLSCFILSIILSFRIGISWDEPDNIFASGVYIKFFQEGMKPEILASRDASASYFHDRIFTQEPSLNRYPPFPLYIGGAFAFIGDKIFGTLTPQQVFIAFHIASGLFWSIFAVSIFYFAQLFGFSILISLLTAIIISFHPTLFSYGLSIIKDSAQVSLFSLSLLLLISGVKQRRKALLMFGTVVWGSAMATKINAVYVPIIWTAWRVLILSYTVWFIKRENVFYSKVKIFLRSLLKIFLQTVFLLVGGGIIMFFLWPYLWFDPINRIQTVLSYFTTVGTGYKVFWNGSIYMAGTGIPLPWYPLVHIVVGTPIPLLLLSLFGIIIATFQILKRNRSSLEWIFFLMLWSILPLLRTLSPQAAFYDGMRHFLEVLPGFFLVSAWAINIGCKLLAKKLGNQQYSNSIITVGLVLYIGMLNLYFFPYGSGYVNGFISNPNTVVEKDFSGLSISEGVNLAHLYRPQPSRIFVPIGGHLSWYYLSPADTYVYNVADSDVLILINKPSHVSKYDFDTQVSSMFDLKGDIRRGNSIFAWIYVKR